MAVTPAPTFGSSDTRTIFGIRVELYSPRGGMAVFWLPEGGWTRSAIVDMDRDGRVDFVMDGLSFTGRLLSKIACDDPSPSHAVCEHDQRTLSVTNLYKNDIEIREYLAITQMDGCCIPPIYRYASSSTAIKTVFGNAKELAELTIAIAIQQLKKPEPRTSWSFSAAGSIYQEWFNEEKDTESLSVAPEMLVNNIPTAFEIRYSAQSPKHRHHTVVQVSYDHPSFQSLHSLFDQVYRASMSEPDLPFSP